MILTSDCQRDKIQQQVYNDQCTMISVLTKKPPKGAVLLADALANGSISKEL